IVDFIVDGIVLGVGALGALRCRAETAVFHTVIVGPLGMPFFVIAKIPHLNVVFLQIGSFGGQVNSQVGFVDLVVLLQLAQAYTTQIDVVVVIDRKEMFVPQSRVVVRNGVAEFRFVLTVEYQRNPK